MLGPAGDYYSVCGYWKYIEGQIIDDSFHLNGLKKGKGHGGSTLTPRTILA